MLDHEVADSDGADLAVGEEGLQCSVGVEGPLEGGGQRLVEDEQVDLVDAELAGALLTAVECLVVAVVADPDLGLEKDLRPVQAGAVNGLADLAFVAVGGGGVDVAVPGAQGDGDGVSGLLGGSLEDAETECRHLDAVVEGYGFHVLFLRVYVAVIVVQEQPLPCSERTWVKGVHRR